MNILPSHATDYLLKVETYKANLHVLDSALYELKMQQSVLNSTLFAAMGQFQKIQHLAHIANTAHLIKSTKECNAKITEEYGITFDCGAEYMPP